LFFRLFIAGNKKHVKASVSFTSKATGKFM